MEWTQLAVQAGGAIAVCGMFLWFLKEKQANDDAARNEFLNHLQEKDRLAHQANDKQMEYLRSRDNQSREIAESGHRALQDIATEVNRLIALVQSQE